MTSPLTLTPTRRADGTCVLTVVGEIDQSNADDLAAALDDAGGSVVVDLTGVGYLDSAGLNVLFARSAGGLELIVPPLLTPVLTVSGLAELVPVHGPEGAAPDAPSG
ncbi:STAS domain-containing protein [Streptomyces sp. D2-8]|uniref:STAS domain-containing protein n=1 Tax=Streptomyces sp. D2-8 TaxID=2707767 RepID=UPI0020BF49E0|nr:STAS domain-containing protein [Streptomyces sp. D2-8]MCK8433000.1 STAS domain-containing protein [Streptomyces sp. D2-8]